MDPAKIIEAMRVFDSIWPVVALIVIAPSVAVLGAFGMMLWHAGKHQKAEHEHRERIAKDHSALSEACKDIMGQVLKVLGGVEPALRDCTKSQDHLARVMDRREGGG